MNNEYEIFTPEDAIAWGSSLLDPSHEELRESQEMSQLFIDIEKNLYREAIIAGFPPIVEIGVSHEFDREVEKRRLMTRVFHNFEAECEISRMFTGEDFIESFEDLYLAVDEALAFTSSQRALDVRSIWEEIDLYDLARFAKSEFEESQEILRDTPEEFFLEEAAKADRWQRFSYVAVDAVELDRSGYGLRAERRFFEGAKITEIRNFFGLFVGGVEQISNEEDGIQLLTMFTEWQSAAAKAINDPKEVEFHARAKAVLAVKYHDLQTFLTNERIEFLEELESLENDPTEEHEKRIDDLNRCEVALDTATRMLKDTDE